MNSTIEIYIGRTIRSNKGKVYIKTQVLEDKKKDGKQQNTIKDFHTNQENPGERGIRQNHIFKKFDQVDSSNFGLYFCIIEIN